MEIKRIRRPFISRMIIEEKHPNLLVPSKLLLVVCNNRSIRIRTDSDKLDFQWCYVRPIASVFTKFRAEPEKSGRGGERYAATGVEFMRRFRGSIVLLKLFSGRAYIFNAESIRMRNGTITNAYRT